MASSSTTMLLYISAVIALCLCVRGALGNVVCEDLNKQSCAYAVSSTGKRCVLEKHVERKVKEEAYTCRTSEIEAGDRFKGRIETDECIQACGLDRNALGISSDSLLDSQFTRKLCSAPCYRGCPNVADLYFSVAVGEGVYLPKLCEAQRADARREMVELKSSSFVAAGPESGGGVKAAKVDPIAPAFPPF